MLLETFQRCSTRALHADAAKTLATKTRSDSAVQLFALVNEQVKKDAAAGRGVSTIQLFKAARVNGAYGAWRF